MLDDAEVDHGLEEEDGLDEDDLQEVQSEEVRLDDNVIRLDCVVVIVLYTFNEQ